MDPVFKKQMIKRYYGDKKIPEHGMKLDAKTCKKMKNMDKKTTSKLKKVVGFK